MAGTTQRSGSGEVPGKGKSRGARVLGAMLCLPILGALALVILPRLVSDPVHAEDSKPLAQAVVPKDIPPLTAAVPASPKRNANRKLIDDFFSGPIRTLKFEFEDEEWEYLQKDHRRYVECTMTEVGQNGAPDRVYKGVAVKLKGSAGSFQGPDGKPGLTVSFNKYKDAERFHGMSKLHLNNGAQDGSYLQEVISGEMGRLAGVPASRCTHALVSWKGREPVPYVVKEAFTKDFFPHFFDGPPGHLYDGGFVKDLEENMEKDEGDPKQREDIKELIAACREGDQKKRWARLEKILDVDRFISFMAMESILCHWDGYNFNKNNYRLYFDGATKRATFFLHGMDQTLNDPNFPVIRDPGTMVGQAVMSNPEWKARYRERVEEIYENVLKPIDWGARVEAVGEKLRAALAAQKEQLGKEYAGRIRETKSRVESRVVAIGKQLGEIPKPFKFDANGLAKIDGKHWRTEGGGAHLDETEVEGKAALRIRAQGGTNASWRKSVQLLPGKYRLEARVRTAGVESSPHEGAGLRISGATRTEPNAATGDSDWKPLQFEFDTQGGDVVLVAELRASKGEVWFERDSFQLVRIP